MIPKLIHLFLAFLILFQGMGISVSNFLQIDELVEHYKEHRATEGDNIIQFIQEHYFDADTHSHNDFSHQELPFKTIDTMQVGLAIKERVNKFVFEFIKVFIKPAFIVTNESYSSLFPSNIIQPPI